MDDLTPVEPSFLEQPPEPVQPPDSYGTGKHPGQRSQTPLILTVVLLGLLLAANFVAVVALARLRSQEIVQPEQLQDGLNLLSPSPTEAGMEDTDRRDVMHIGSEQNKLSLQELYQKVSPSITVVTARCSSGVNTGTGVLLDSDGYLLTNAHTVVGALRLEVTLSDGTDCTAAFVGMDSESDDKTVNVHINRLRTRFYDWPEFEIQTIRGIGYRAIKKV